MAHLSKYTIPEKDTKEMSDKLFDILTSIEDREQTKAFLKELLTPTEQIMIAKRLAVIAMIDQGHSSSAIRDFVNVSSSTTRKLYAKNIDGDFSAINHYLSKSTHKTTTQSFIQFLIKISAPNARTRKRSDLYKDSLE